MAQHPDTLSNRSLLRRRRLLLALCLLLGAAAGIGFLRQRLRAPLPPLEVSLWYWHQPFRLAPAEVADLKALGVRQLFVHAGTFRRDGDGAALVLPQQWASRAEGLDIQLVFNFDYTIVRSYGDLSNEALAATIETGVQRERERAQRAGLKVAGFQFDFDCPTRRLPKYAALLRLLRAQLGKSGTQVSITALPTWFTSDDVQTVLDAVDFSVPQYYEANIPKTLNQFATVSRLSLAARGLESAGSRGRPFYVGLPAYGHALVYDEKGALVGLYRDMSVRDALRHPAFRLARAFGASRYGTPATPTTYIGEDLYDFVAVRSAPDGRGKGYHLVYDLPTPTLLARHLALVREQRPPNCRGVILFRYGEPGDTTALPIPAIAAALRAQKAQPSLRVQFKARPAPWELIETGQRAARPPLDLTVTVTNVGAASTFLAPDAVTLTLRFDRPGCEDAPLRDFDAVEAFYSEPSAPGAPPADSGLRSSLARANVLRFRKAQLAPGESAQIGPIRLPPDSATRVWGAWTATDAGGFDVLRGNIGPSDLTAQKGDSP